MIVWILVLRLAHPAEGHETDAPARYFSLRACEEAARRITTALPNFYASHQCLEDRHYLWDPHKWRPEFYQQDVW